MKLEKDIIKDLKKDGLSIQNIPKSKQSYKMCITAFKQNPGSTIYMSEKNKKACFDHNHSKGGAVIIFLIIIVITIICNLYFQ